jgi:hypothetical protein
VALEATKGTAVAATRILMARVTNANFNQPREFVEEDRGTLVGATRFNAGVKDYTFAIEADGASYEQLGWFLETCLKGSVSATTVNTTGKQYVFSPNTTTAGDDLQAATFEFGDDTQSYRAAYCEGTSWTLAFDTLTVGQAAPLKLTVNYLTKSLASNTKTAALTSPTVESILGTSAHFYLGSASTAFGSLAEVTGSLRSFSLTSDNKLGRKVFVGDGDTYTNIGRGRRMTTFEAIFEADSNGVTRFVEWDLATAKRMRLQFVGSTIASSAPATAKQLLIDGQIYFTAFDPIGEVDTNVVYKISGRYIEDSSLATANSDIAVTLRNAESSYT